MKTTQYCSSILVFLLLIAAGSCSFSSRVKIDGNSVKIEQGQYNYDSIDLTFYAELTDTISPDKGVYWSRYDGRFHKDGTLTNGVTLSYEVLNPFGEVELRTLNDATGPSKTAQLPLPVFWSEENPYEYTLRVTFYINGKKQDCYTARFRLTLP
jgi:beta-galactosidase/beta-glucuronidase